MVNKKHFIKTVPHINLAIISENFKVNNFIKIFDQTKYIIVSHSHMCKNLFKIKNILRNLFKDLYFQIYMHS